MPRPPEKLRRDALAIWHAGLEAVRSERLVRQTLRVEGDALVAGAQRLPLEPGRPRSPWWGRARRGPAWPPPSKRCSARSSWTATASPAGSTCRPIAFAPPSRIHLHAARPAGRERADAGRRGRQPRKSSAWSVALGPDDLCLCLISGGGSALLPAPAEGVTLADKLAVTRHLSAAGANIEELNTVRKQLSRIKGGGLARACRAGRLVALIISDVLGDPLDVIASGPTVEDSSTPEAALDVLRAVHGPRGGHLAGVFDLPAGRTGATHVHVAVPSEAEGPSCGSASAG